MEAKELFDEALEWLKKNYNKHDFFNERDIEYRLHKYIKDKISEKNLPFQVFNDWPLESGRKYVDLVIRKKDETSDFKVEVAIELKYEPDKKRGGDDLRKGKLEQSTVFWCNKQGQSSVEGDIKRAHDYVWDKKATAAYAIFVDEGCRFYYKHKHDKPDVAKWDEGWKKGMAVLIVKYPLV
mgnify:CR=1 FL=1